MRFGRRKWETGPPAGGQAGGEGARQDGATGDRGSEAGAAPEGAQPAEAGAVAQAGRLGQGLRVAMARLETYSRTVVGRPLRPYQLEPAAAVLRAMREGAGGSFSVAMSRQAGKNELSAHLEAYALTSWAKGDADATIVKAAPTFRPQAITSMERLKAVLKNPLAEILEIGEEQGYVVRLGRASATFLSAATSANVVGATASLLLEIDEAQEVETEKYDRDFAPMAGAYDAPRVFYGTAGSADGLLERMKQHHLELERKDGIKRHFEYPWWVIAEQNPAYARFVEGGAGAAGGAAPGVPEPVRAEDGRAGRRAAGRRAAPDAGGGPPAAAGAGAGADVRGGGGHRREGGGPDAADGLDGGGDRGGGDAVRPYRRRGECVGGAAEGAARAAGAPGVVDGAVAHGATRGLVRAAGGAVGRAGGGDGRNGDGGDAVRAAEEPDDGAGGGGEHPRGSEDGAGVRADRGGERGGAEDPPAGRERPGGTDALGAAAGVPADDAGGAEDELGGEERARRPRGGVGLVGRGGEAHGAVGGGDPAAGVGAAEREGAVWILGQQHFLTQAGYDPIGLRNAAEGAISLDARRARVGAATWRRPTPAGRRVTSPGAGSETSALHARQGGADEVPVYALRRHGAHLSAVLGTAARVGLLALAVLAPWPGSPPPAAGQQVHRQYVPILARHPAPVTVGRWPTFKGDFRRTGRSAVRGPREPNVLWRAPVGGHAPAVAPDGTIVVSDGLGFVSGVSPTGALLWRTRVGDRGTSGVTIGRDGTVYVGSTHVVGDWGQGGNISALATDGRILWQQSTWGGSRSTPALGSDGTVYGGGAGVVQAHQPDGSLRWRRSLPTLTMSSLTQADDGTLYVGGEQRAVFAVGSDGTVKWRYPTEGLVWSTPAVGDDGTVYAGARDTYLHAIGPDGARRWRTQVGDVAYSSPSIGRDGTLYIGSQSGGVVAVDRSGRVLWRVGLGSHATDPVVDADGIVYVYVGGADGHLLALRPDGSTKWSVALPGVGTWGIAMGPHGRLYVAAGDGLYAIGDGLG